MREALKEILGTILLALLFFLLLRISLDNVRVEGTSMEPTLQGGEHLLVNKVVYWRLPVGKITRFFSSKRESQSRVLFPFHPPRRGDVVVFQSPRAPARDFIKRVIGVPGDVVEIRNGKVYVNDKELEEPYVTNGDYSSARPLRVPQGSYYVLGDNRANSNDSRDWGPVSGDNIIGKAWLTYWPPSSLGLLQTIYPLP